MKLNELRALIQEAIAEETSNKFSIKDKLNNILFGKDEKGVDGYLSQEWRLKRDITPKERSLRIALIIDQLKNYIKSLEEVANDEETFVKATTNEGFFGPSKKDIADFEAELNNFIEKLERINSDESSMIYMNQIEYNPFLNRNDLVKRCKNLGIRITAYGSLYKYNDYIQNLGKKYKVSPESILLAWAQYHNVSVIPMSRSANHIKTNFEAIKLQLEEYENINLDNYHENYTRFLKHL